jgi:hypothetical protein
VAWDRSAPTAAKYRSKTHTDTRKRLMALLKVEGQGLCAETVCVYPSRLITPDMDLHLCHDTTGQTYAGLGHRLCNVTEAAKRARARQTPVRHWTDTPDRTAEHARHW